MMKHEDYDLTLPDLKPGDFVGMNADGSLAVTLCHRIYSASGTARRKSTGERVVIEAQCWHTKEGGYVGIESGTPPVALADRTSLVAWLRARGARMPEPGEDSITIVVFDV